MAKDTKINNKASSLMEKILKNSTIKQAEPLLESDLLQEKETTSTKIPMINLALGGKFVGGIGAGITTIAGPSKHFKTSFGLVMVAAFLDKYQDAVCIFLNNEFGAKKAYFEQYGVDTSRVIHVPFEDIEKLTFETVRQLKELTETENVIFLIDSIGNASSIKEVEDALAEKGVSDMSRAKKLKSYFRIITPMLYMKNIPLIAINHTYKTQEMFAKDVVGGGTGIMYSSDTVWIIGKNQLKEKDEITGSKFIIRVEKSRYIKEKSQFPITVRWTSGIAKWSGFEDVAEQLGIIYKSKIGKSGAYSYDRLNGETIQTKADQIDNADEFWNVVLEETDLQFRMENLYSIGCVASDTLSFEMGEEAPEAEDLA